MKHNDFPGSVRFDPLNQDWEATPDKWGVFGVHDPSMIEADGWYYVFSTGTFRRDLYIVFFYERIVYQSAYDLPVIHEIILSQHHARLQAVERN